MVTWFLLMYACTVTVAATLVPWRCPTLSKWLNSAAFLTLGVLALVAHVRTMLTDPGAVPRDAVPLGTATEEGNSETAALNRHDLEAGEEQPAYKKWCRCNDACVKEQLHASVHTVYSATTHDTVSAFFAVYAKAAYNSSLNLLLLRADVMNSTVTYRRCEAFKPTRAHHCSVCGRCNVFLDHHCPCKYCYNDASTVLYAITTAVATARLALLQ
eukprot:2209-Heterococcus_DN1.PRE.1